MGGNHHIASISGCDRDNLELIRMASNVANFKWSSSSEHRGADYYKVLGEFETDSNGKAVSSLLKIIQCNRSAYLFLCVMGLVPTNDSFVNLGIPKIGVFIWNVFLFVSLVLAVLMEFIIGLGSRLDEKTLNSDYSVDAFVIVLFLLFQFGTLVYTVTRLKDEITAKHAIDEQTYSAQVKYAFRICCRVLVVISVFTLLGFFFYLAYCMTEERDASMSRLWFVSIPTALQPLLLIGSNFYLVGILFIVVIEERMTLMSIKRLISKVKDRTITHKEYIATQREIQSREDKLPINLLCITALLNSLFGIIIYILFANLDRSSGPYYAAYAVFVELTFFGRELLFLCLVLYEIVTINEQGRLLVQVLSESEWEECDAESGASQSCSDKNRQSVLLAALGSPMGATIFYKQPTMGMVLFRLASTIIVTILATLRVYFISM